MIWLWYDMMRWDEMACWHSRCTVQLQTEQSTGHWVAFLILHRHNFKMSIMASFHTENCCLAAIPECPPVAGLCYICPSELELPRPVRTRRCFEYCGRRLSSYNADILRGTLDLCPECGVAPHHHRGCDSSSYCSQHTVQLQSVKRLKVSTYTRICCHLHGHDQ